MPEYFEGVEPMSWEATAIRLQQEKIALRDEAERLHQAGDRLAVCLRSSFNVDGYGSPEHEAACREALREWQWERRS